MNSIKNYVLTLRLIDVFIRLGVMDEPAGYKVLVEMGMHDLTFEAVIVRYPDTFNQEVVSRAKSRLKELTEI